MSSTSLVKAPDEAQPLFEFEFYDADGIGIKQMHAPKKGVEIPQHSHCYDHTSMLARGKVALYANGVYQGVFRAPCGILIKAGVKHKFLILEDDTIIYCIHNVSRTGEIDVQEEHELEFER